MGRPIVRALGRIGINLAILMFLILPGLLAVFWVMSGMAMGFDTTDLVPALIFNYMTFAAPVLLAGIAQQVLLVLLFKVLHTHQRLAAVASTILIPLAMSPISVPIGVYTNLRALVPALMMLLLFGILMRLPDSRKDSVHQGG